jgi:hypothetical protein
VNISRLIPGVMEHEISSDGNMILIAAPNAIVTVDLIHRGFRAGGWTRHGAMSSIRQYRGRGWLNRLVFDAVLWVKNQS